MENNHKPSSGELWVKTFTWQDKVIARCFPRFFRKYAPQEIQEQWAAYLRRKEKPSQDGHLPDSKG